MALIGETMPDSTSRPKEQRPDPNEKLVRVFDTEQESEALIVRGLLDSAGIESDLTSLDAQQDILPGVGGTIILVREEDAARARQMIEDYRQTPEELETAEIAVMEEPSQEK
jgi:Putative prokaryotic signal transducing protein